MLHRHWWKIGIVALSVLSFCGTADAQSESKSYANTEMSRIKANDIGRGYSISSLNRQDLQRGQASIPNVGQANTPRSYVSELNVGGGGPREKPFSRVSYGPTVSPYMNLFRDDLDGSGDFNYQTLVRPQLEQQRINEQVQRQNFEISRRVQSLSARADYNPQGSQQQSPTGHPTSFMYYGRYYPSAGRR
jgi:hypothetical protein